MNNYRDRLTDEVRADIIAARLAGAKTNAIARAYRMPPGLVSAIVKGLPLTGNQGKQGLDTPRTNLERARSLLAKEFRQTPDRLEIGEAITIIDRLIAAPS